MQRARTLIVSTRLANSCVRQKARGTLPQFRVFASQQAQPDNAPSAANSAVKVRRETAAAKKVGDALPQAARRRPPPAVRRATDAPASYIHGMLRECLTPHDVLRVWTEESASADAIAHAAALQRLSFLQGGVAPHKRKALPLHTVTERLGDLQRTMAAELLAPPAEHGQEEHPALRPRTLSSVAHALGKMGLAAPQLMQQIVTAAEGRMRRFNTADINQILHGTSMTGTASDALLMAAASRLRRLRSEVGTREAAGIASSAAAICRGRGSALATRSDKDVLALYRFVRGEATPEPLDAADAAHIALSVSGGRLLKAVQATTGLPRNHLQAAMKKADLSPQALSNFVHALAKSGLPHLALAEKRKRAEVAGTGPLVLVSAAEVLQRIAPTLVATMRSQSTIGLACIANAYKQLGVTDVTVWGELARCAQHPQRLGAATPHQIATLTTAVAWAHHAAGKTAASPSEQAEFERALNTPAVFRAACKGMLRHLEPPPVVAEEGLISTKRTYAPAPIIPPQPRDLVELRSACVAVGHSDTQLAALATRAMLPQLRATPPHLAARFVQDLAAEDVRPHHAAEALQHVAHFASVATALAQRSKPPQIGRLLQVAACGTPPPPAGAMALAARWLRQQVGPHAAVWSAATPFQLARAVQDDDEEAVKVAMAAMQVAHDEEEVGDSGSPATQLAAGQPNHPRNAAAGVTPHMFLQRVVLPVLRYSYSAEGKVAPLDAALPAEPAPQITAASKAHTTAAAPTVQGAATPRGGSIGGYLDAFAGAGDALPVMPSSLAPAPAERGGQRKHAQFKFRTSEWSLPDLVVTLGCAATVTDLPPAEAAGAFGQLAHRVLALPPAAARSGTGVASEDATAAKRMAQLTAPQAACAAAAAARLGQLAVAAAGGDAAATSRAEACMHTMVEAAALRVARADACPPADRFHTLAVAAWAAALAGVSAPEVHAALQHELLLAHRGSSSAVGLAPNTAALLAHVDEMAQGELLATMPRPVLQLLAAAKRQYGGYSDWAKPCSWTKLQGKCGAEAV